jgi:hypothetical protein
MEKATVEYLPVRYADCRKGGFHEGEPMNYVCLEEGCQDACLICNFCQEESHKGHQTKTLKRFLNNIMGNIKKTSAVKIDIPRGLQLVDSLEQDSLKALEGIRGDLMTLLKNVEEAICNYKQHLHRQFIAKEKELNSFETESVLEMLDPSKPEQLCPNLKKLRSYYKEKDIRINSQPQIEKIIGSQFEQLKARLTAFRTRIGTDGQVIIEDLRGIERELIWFERDRCEFKPELKHQDI